MKHRTRRLIAIGIAFCALAMASPATADVYDSRESGHPLRILAYVGHPIGVLLDVLIFRPAHWVVSHEPMAELFGHKGYPN